MTQRLALDVSDYPALVHGPRGSLWWGMLGLVIIEVVVFGMLIVSYFYLKFHSPFWPPAGEELPQFLLPTINTLVLIGSSLAIGYADHSISEKGDQRGLRIGLIGSFVLGLAFVVLKVVEYADVGYFWDSHAYGSVVWTMIVFHSSHVVSVLMKTVVVLTLAYRGYWTQERCQGVKVNGLYWHFVVVIWIPLYITIYVVPRIPTF